MYVPYTLFCINRNEVWKIKSSKQEMQLFQVLSYRKRKHNPAIIFSLLPSLVLSSSSTHCLMSPIIFLQRTFPHHITQPWKYTSALVVWPEKNRRDLKKCIHQKVIKGVRASDKVGGLLISSPPLFR